MKALEGVRILDMTHVQSGPPCTQLLAWFGADVIKVERPGEGDEMRRAPLQLPGEGDQSTYFARRNAGKESIAIDLSTSQGQGLVLALAEHVDVVVENFRPGVAARMGVGNGDNLCPGHLQPYGVQPVPKIAAPRVADDAHAQLAQRAPQHHLLHAVLRDQAHDGHAHRLGQKAARARDGLQVHLRVPVAVEDDHGVGGRQVATEPARARREDEEEAHDLRLTSRGALRGLVCRACVPRGTNGGQCKSMK